MSDVKPPRLPPIDTLARIVADVRRDLYRYDADDVPYIQVTIGIDGRGGWGYQTGDNSYSGAAYHYPYWGVAEVYRRRDVRETARDVARQLRNDAAEAYWASEPYAPRE
jgi:hypothetical protein